MTDPIADMLTRMRNIIAVKKTEVILPYSRIKYDLAKILEEEHWIEKAEIFSSAGEGETGEDIFNNTSFKQIKIALKYDKQGQSAIKSLKRISRPGQRIYVKKDKIPSVLSGLGMVILSTPQGLMTGQRARKNRLGGELICEIY